LARASVRDLKSPYLSIVKVATQQLLAFKPHETIVEVMKAAYNEADHAFKAKITNLLLQHRQVEWVQELNRMISTHQASEKCLPNKLHQFVEH